MSQFAAMRKRAEQRAHRYPQPCRLCDANHPIRLCPLYRAKSPEERLREALLGRYCANCLAMNHELKDCVSEGRCKRCGEKHHSTLHFEDEPSTSKKSWAQQVEEEEENSDGVISLLASDSGTESRPFRPDTEEGALSGDVAETRPLRAFAEGGSETRPFRPLLQHERNRLRGAETRPFRLRNPRRKSSRRKQKEGRLATRPHQLSKRRTFRNGILGHHTIAAPTLQPMIAIAPTAVVKVEAGGRLHLIRALVDVCSPRTIISLDLARELRLDETRVSGERGCLLCLRGKYGQNKRVATHAIALANFSRISPSSNADASVAEPYAHIRLADPRFYASAPIRVILGTDVYADILLPGTLPTTFGPLLAQSTIFGWVLSGVSRA
ncbi:uncharacterized protein LOC118749480 [Rhagoletis pomonella]|uniref:uncharacterized protein LOC118749480 n=1 Tax=Rhagoletis pomonella TaxID=28610 RepID=UPI00177E9E38|nr:uncharacterized protein LOC118749480 [Rhagoletis pomonella]